MNFEKIELIGFKSFADKCEIVFDNGVTAIVGPNGCGKSNIADAVRWVLGEQSAKTLRGSSMTDVIFNGTQNRKSLSYCEVSLYFDNSNRIFKSSEYNEVILTRKLFRNGDSEYYVNKQPARLRDIVDLLHECGVSKNGYSIIGQGKVSEILSSKPADRRAIFEEAVGIAKSKASRLESERKLERTRENIVRLSDIMDEITRQLEPASRAKDKTQKFLELSEQLKYHEINNYLFKHENATGAKEKIAVRIAAIAEEIAVNESELAKANESYTRHMHELTESDGVIAALHDEILQKSLDQEKLQGQTNVYNERISFFRQEIDRLKSSKKEYADRIALLKKAIDARSDELKGYLEEYTDLETENDELSEKLNALIAEISKGENLTQSTNTRILSAAEEIAGLSKNIGSLDTEMSVFSDRQREVLDKLDKLTAVIAELSREKSTLEDDIAKKEDLITQLEDGIAKVETAISSLNQKISDIANRTYNLNLEIANLNTTKRFYQGIKESYEGYPGSVKRLMLDAKGNKELARRIKGIVGNVISCDKKFDLAIESAIGNAVYNAITATPEDAQYLLEYLKSADVGRVTFLPVSSVKPHINGEEITRALNESGALGLATEIVKFDPYFTRVIDYLLGNTLVVDTSANALFISKKYSFNFKIVTLDGDIFNPSGSITGGSKRSNQSSVLAADRMIETLTEKINKIEAQITALNGEKQKLTDKSNELVEKLDLLEKKYSETKDKKLVLSERLASIAGIIDERNTELSEYEGVVSSVKARLEQLSAEYVRIEEGNKILVEQKETATSENEKIQLKYEKLRAERDALIDRLTRVKARLSFLNSETNNARADVERMSSDLADTEAMIAKAEEDIAADLAIIENFYKEIEKLTLSCEEISGVKELRDKLAEYEDRKQNLSTLIAQDDFKRQLHNSEITKLNERRLEEEVAITKVDSELEFMAQRVQDEYNLTYEMCVGLRDENYDIAGSNQEINHLKHKIASLGNINPNAIEEYLLLNERYESQKTQLDDLYKAEADIKSAIKRLTDEMLVTFNDGFSQIREHFKKIFKELFGGGTADLILDYSEVDDPLEAGVEIVAEPPGKKLQKISLLSGGEMSLTAIAILFAILKLRPMPFCVLDEIEAALDDANVERFARYLQNFSKETQFVVITHKKVTMELSDALFGVTMQEKGVSKIVSVKLSEINETLQE